MRMKYGIAVGGAHGKTTTTWIIGLAMAAAGLDPTIIVGGRLKALGTNAKLGSGPYLVAEADESDGSFLKLSPNVAVVTTIDEEHLDHYNDIEAIKATFVEFVNKVPFYGAAIVCLDQENVQAIIPGIVRRVITYGFSHQADVRVTDVAPDGQNVTFNVSLRGSRLGSVLLRMRGEHNILNALAGVAVGLELDIPFSSISEGISQFTGISRRLEHKGEVKGITIVDDYAHHPTEVMATLHTLRSMWDGRIVGVFQPHRYTRTQALWERLGRSFYDADCIVISSIYAAGERPLPGVDAQLVAEAALRSGHREVNYLPDREKVIDFLLDTLAPGDLVVTLGAGDIWKVGDEIMRRLSGD
jgi:UDP-N-acetylmuramate--alanine ligase